MIPSAATPLSTLTHDESLSPPLKWAGGKRWLLPQLRQMARDHHARRLVEPFVGGMAVALGLQPSQALLNDSNPHLINFYEQIRRGLSIPDSDLRNERDFFFAQRARFNRLIEEGTANSAEAAGLFYYLNRTCFNGLCRFNNKGFFNVPFGQYKTISYTRDFSEYRLLFQRWSFTCGDFEKLAIESNDLLYVDPPYDVEFTKYAQEDFTWADQERLVAWLRSLSVPMIVSNQATERIVALYEGAGFTIEKVSAPRRISCTGDREPALEMVAHRNL